MFNFLLIVMLISIALLLVETVYIFTHMNTNMHAYLFLFLITVLINNVGYVFEMTAQTSEAAYLATRFLYFGKVMFPYAMLIFVLRFCRVNVPKWLSLALGGIHIGVYLIIAFDPFLHWYYSSISFTEEGIFPHNVYGHGPAYFIYQAVPIIYTIVAVVVTSIKIGKLKTLTEKKQLVYLLVAPICAIVGLLVFFTGVTKGFDTSNLGLVFCAMFMTVPLFKYRLVDTVDMLKSNLVDSLTDGIIAVDPYDNVVYVNDTAKRVFPGLDVGSAEKYKAIIRDLVIRCRSKEHVESDGSIFVLNSQNLFQGDVYRGTMFVLDNVTESIEYTREIEYARDRADAANEAKSLFLSNMSHEIRTPMNAIVGITDILLRENLSDSQQGYLENIRSSGNALLDIINDILDLSKIESGKMEIIEDEYEPLPLLNDLKVIFQTRIGDSPIRMNYDIDEKLPAKLYGDSLRIRQVIINVTNNAIKYTNVGYVNLKVRVSDNVDGKINLIISVKDSGQGIKAEDLPHLFESFVQTDSQLNHGKEGTGLGLPITKELLEMMGGTIEAASEYGKGSEFTLIIPQKVIDSTPAGTVIYKRRDSGSLNFSAPKARVLLVEDNEVNVKVAQGLFKPLKFSMDVAENGLVALKKIAEKRYDFVFMDHMMPVMDGVEATTRIRALDDEYFKRVPIIALTANATTGARETFISAGMNDFIGKPINIRDVCAALKRWLPPELIVEEEENESGKGDTPVKKAVRSSDEIKEIGLPDDNSDKNNDKSIESNEKGEDQNMAFGELDREVGIQYCGTEELYESVLEDFYRLIETKAAKIEQLLADGDIRNYTIEVHALKSTCRMIGATATSELAFKLEQAGNAEDIETIKAETPLLMEMYRAYLTTLSYFDAADGATEKKEVPSSTIKSELFKMNVAAKDFDMDTVDEAMSNLNSYKMPNEEAEKALKELDTCVRDVDLDNIRTLTAQLAKMI